MLIPREHGAYGQLGFPILTVLAAGRPSLAAMLLVVASAAAFVAHEPMLVQMGHRGPRAKRELAQQARRMLWATSALAIAAGLTGGWLMPPPIRWTVVIPALFALAAFPLIAWRTHKQVGGEIYLAVSLSAAALPAGAASSLRIQDATLCAAIFALGFSAATLAVRGTIAVQRREASSAMRVGAAALALANLLLVAAATSRLSAHPLSWTAALPLSMLTAALAAAPPSARQLYRIGWGLTAAATATAVVLVGLIRAGR